MAGRQIPSSENIIWGNPEGEGSVYHARSALMKIDYQFIPGTPWTDMLGGLSIKSVPGGAVGDGVVDDSDAIAAKDAAAAAAGKALIIPPGTYRFAQNKTLTAHTVMVKGAQFTGTGTVTMRVPMAGSYQLFASTLTVKFSSVDLPVLPDWFVTRINDTTDYRAAVLAANATSTGHKVIALGAQVYTLMATTALINPCTIRGAGRATTLRFGAAAQLQAKVTGITFEDLTLITAARSLECSLYTDKSRTTFRNLYADGFGGRAIYVYPVPAIEEIVIENCELRDTDGEGILWTGVGGKVSNSRVTGVRTYRAGYAATRLSPWITGMNLGENCALDNVIVSDCIVEESWWGGYWLESTGPYTRVSYINCQAIRNGQVGTGNGLRPSEFRAQAGASYIGCKTVLQSDYVMGFPSAGVGCSFLGCEENGVPVDLILPRPASESNLIPNGDFSQRIFPWCVWAVSMGVGREPPGDTQFERATIADGQIGTFVGRNLSGQRANISTMALPVNPLKTYDFEVWARRTVAGTAGVLYAGVEFWDSTQRLPNINAYTNYLINSVTVPTAWTQYTGSFGAGTGFTVPTGATHFRVWLWLNYSGGIGGDRVYEVQGVYVRERKVVNVSELTGSTLVLDPDGTVKVNSGNLNLQSGTGGGEYLRLNPAGGRPVFIGSTSVGANLYVYSVSNDGKALQVNVDTNSNDFFGPAGNAFSFQINSVDFLRILTGGALEIPEITAPANAPTDKARIYAEDNGAGKTRLVVKFPSGSAQVIATEP